MRFLPVCVRGKLRSGTGSGFQSSVGSIPRRWAIVRRSRSNTAYALASSGETTSMSFLRHEEIYRSDVRLGQSWERQSLSSLPVLIGCDEFPVGYSLAGCPPAEPASASPTADDSQQPTLPYNFSANGNYSFNVVSQPKGALHCAPSSKPPPPPGLANRTKEPTLEGNVVVADGAYAGVCRFWDTLVEVVAA
jgi:hypothetical protein